MAINTTLLDLVVWPETKQPVRLVGPDTVAKLNQLIGAESLRNVRGNPVRDPLTDALVREDGAVAYGVVSDIPVMLVDEAIPLSQLA